MNSEMATQVISTDMVSSSITYFNDGKMIQQDNPLFAVVNSATPPASPPLEWPYSTGEPCCETNKLVNGIHDHGSSTSPQRLCAVKLEHREIPEGMEDLSQHSINYQPELHDGQPIPEDKKLTGPHVMDNLLKTRCPVDTVICCRDGRIGAHRMVLTAASPFLGLLFREQKLGEVAVLVLPDIPRKIMETLLHLAYTGRMIYPPEDEEQILSAIECLCFACTADLELTMVNVVKRKPVPPVPVELPRTSDAGPSILKDNSTQDRRKREAEEFGEKGKSPAKKKLRFESGKAQKSKRTGAPIGKLGVAKMRKRQWRRTVSNPASQRKPEYIVSDTTTNTVRINPRKLPIVSVQLTKITNQVCIEVPTGRKRWFDSEEEREHYFRVSRDPEAEDVSSSDWESDSKISFDNGKNNPLSPNVGYDHGSLVSLDSDCEMPGSISQDVLTELSSNRVEESTENDLFMRTPLSKEDTQTLEATIALQSRTNGSKYTETECEVYAVRENSSDGSLNSSSNEDNNSTADVASP